MLSNIILYGALLTKFNTRIWPIKCNFLKARKETAVERSRYCINIVRHISHVFFVFVLSSIIRSISW